MMTPFQTATRWVLNGATRLSDHVFRGMLEKSAQRLGNELALPPHFIQHLLAMEDKRFAYHPGVDPLAILRAFIFNVGTRPTRPHGASTIVQQVYSGAVRRRGAYTPTLRFKLAQTVWAVRSTSVRSKPAVLRGYLDSVYFGKSFYGLRQASIGYCGRAPHDLSVADSFFLAERIARPNAVSVRRIEMLLARSSIIALFSADLSVMRELPVLYERHFDCGEAIAICLENSLKKQVGRTSMSSVVVSNAR
jgi:hypothetical protein